MKTAHPQPDPIAKYLAEWESHQMHSGIGESVKDYLSGAKERFASITRACTPKRVLQALLVLCPAVLAIGAAVALQDSEPADYQLKAAVERKLMATEGLFVERLNAQAADGVVTLTGAAYDPEMMERAAEAARSCAGTREVVNHIEIKVTGRADQEIAADLNKSLQNIPVFHSSALTAEVINGVAYLNGKVPSGGIKELAGQIARNTEGVVGVSNLIGLADEPSTDDVPKTVTNGASTLAQNEPTP